MVDFELLEQFDNFATFRNGIRWVAADINEYAGIPMPLDDDELIIEPTYRNAAGLTACGLHDESPPSDIKIRNTFWSHRHRCNVVLWDEDGKVLWGAVPEPSAVARELKTIGCSVAWGIEQESRAVHTLGRLIKHHQMKSYLLTGAFLERSQRSGLSYMFRKLRPTVVIYARDPKAESIRILCTLCLHPIAYYAGSGAGAMAPTDDVIAHLILMRGDEHMLWRRANQHPSWHPSSRLV